jgi:hypothetical protein
MSNEMTKVLKIAAAGALLTVAVDHFLKPSVNKAVRL